MKDNAWYTYVAAALALSVVIAFGAGLGLGRSGSSAVGGSSSSSPSAVAFVGLTVAWNPVNGLDEYFPGNFTVPAHTLIKFTIISYDNGTNVVPAMYAQVSGVVGSTEQIIGSSGARQVSSLPTNGISHTFTILSSAMSGGSGGGMGGSMMLNAVIPPSDSMGQPITVAFETYFNATGSFVWNCLAPCDGDAMSLPGLMTGTVTVV